MDFEIFNIHVYSASTLIYSMYLQALKVLMKY